MVAGRGGAGTGFAWGFAAMVATGCLTRQHVDEDGSSGGPTGTSEAGSSAGSSTMNPDIMTTTETPEETGEPSCADGEQNQGESDVDCGGPCVGCGAGRDCVENADCTSQACAAGVCVAATCFTDDDCKGMDTACTAAKCGPDFTCAPAPAHEGEACDDEDLCTPASACQAGSCAATETLDCSHFDGVCTVGVCDPSSGACVAADVPDGSECEDGDGCTLTSTCEAGTCQASGGGALFFEDFSGPGDAWTRDKLWEIGAAKASPMGAGGVDPDEDRSETDDNRLAGVSIGNLDTTTSHSAWCLSSPAIDASMVDGDLWVSFWRHLHSPALPLVKHTVEAFNGAAWVVLESGYPNAVDDGAWTFMKYNASDTKNASFRVRFCTERMAGAENFAGWSVDDVTIAGFACTP